MTGNEDFIADVNRLKDIKRLHAVSIKKKSPHCEGFTLKTSLKPWKPIVRSVNLM
jgi:hypothetical protein